MGTRGEDGQDYFWLGLCRGDGGEKGPAMALLPPHSPANKNPGWGQAGAQPLAQEGPGSQWHQEGAAERARMGAGRLGEGPTCLPSLGFICKSDLIITILPIPLSLETGGPDLKGQKWVYRKWQRLAEARLGKAPPAPLPGSLSASLGDTDLEPISSNEQMGRQARRGEGTCPCCAVLRSHSGQPRPDPAPQVYL